MRKKHTLTAVCCECDTLTAVNLNEKLNVNEKPVLSQS